MLIFIFIDQPIGNHSLTFGEEAGAKGGGRSGAKWEAHRAGGGAEIESRVRVNAGKPQGASGALSDEVAGRQGRLFNQHQQYGAECRTVGPVDRRAI